MEKVNFPRGLIRYTSYNNIVKEQKLKITPRIIGYSMVFIGLLAIVSTLLLVRKPIDTTILRTPGVMFQETADGYITNLYNIKIVNKTFDTRQITIRLKTPEGRIRQVGGDLTAEENSVVQSAFFVELPKEQVRVVRTPIQIEIISDSTSVDIISTSFLGPNLWQNQKE